MTAPAPRVLPDPAPRRGLSRRDFVQLARGGLGDGHNSFAHSMTWFRNKLYFGSTRSNLCMLRVQSSYTNTPLEVWPTECPDNVDDLYHLDRRAQIWCYDPADGSWELVFRSPMVPGAGGQLVAREIGYRSMEVYQGADATKPSLYVSAWAPGRAPGGLILRSTDGRNFEPITKYGIIDPPFSTTRSLTTFKGKLHFAPTAQRGGTGGQQNSALPQVFVSDTPERQNWVPVNEPGFGDPKNSGIFSLAVANGQLYAGTLNTQGLQIWATDGEEGPPYRWRMICDKGAGRGPLNEVSVSMAEFRGALFVGTGIQGGGNDRVNNIGPGAAEILRVNQDDSVDVIVGDRDGEDRESLSGLRAGFGHFFNGYIWDMTVHDGWLYAGTYDWAMTLRWAKLDGAPARVRELMEMIGKENIVAADGGFDLWRTADGENWMPVDKRGFGNPYNWGVRNLVSTPVGLFVGTSNVFGPRVAVRDGDGWAYEDNPDGGLEVWLGSHAPQGSAPGSGQGIAP